MNYAGLEHCRWTGKVIIRTQKAADRLLVKLKERRAVESRRQERRSYQCEYCSYFHLTSKTEEEAKRFAEIPDYPELLTAIAKLAVSHSDTVYARAANGTKFPFAVREHEVLLGEAARDRMAAYGMIAVSKKYLPGTYGWHQVWITEDGARFVMSLL